MIFLLRSDVPLLASCMRAQSIAFAHRSCSAVSFVYFATVGAVLMYFLFGAPNLAHHTGSADEYSDLLVDEASAFTSAFNF
jgi:hypothetical protein